MGYTADKNVFNTQINNDISTQSLPNSIPPDVVGAGYTDLADLLEPYINSINNQAILSGSAVPGSGTGNDLDLYYRLQSSYFELYRKESGAWVLKVNVPFGITLPDGPATLRTFIDGTTASVTKGGWFISNAVYNKLTQTNFTVPAADATFYRTDLIYADTSNAISYLTGTPSLTPVDPTLPANTIAVDYVIVPSVASSFDPYLRFGSTTEQSGLSEQNDTGALTYAGISIASGTTVNIGACTGQVVDNETVPGESTLVFVNYAGETGKTVTTVGSGLATYVLLNAAGVIVFQNTFPTSAQRKTHIYLSKIGHPAGTITTAGDEVDFVLSPLAQHRDLFQAINYINTGVAPSASGATLNFALSTGVITGDGINFVADKTNPNNYTVAPQPTATFLRRTQTGAGGGFVSLLDVGNYDVSGTVTAIPGGANTSTLQYIYYVPPLGLIVQYGQTTYASLTDAIAAVGRETFTIYPSLVRNSILVGVVAVVKSATALNNTAQARFFLADKFGSIGGSSAGVSTATLQSAYANSLQPQITTTTPLGAVQVKRGSAADTDNVFQVLNAAGTAQFSVRGNGDVITPTNVKFYGAVGDGVTNDTAAIATALATTDNLYFPPGNYLATVTISGNGKNLKFDKSFWTGSALGGAYITGGVVITGNDNYLDGVGIQNVSGNGVTIDTNGSRNTIVNGIANVQNHGFKVEQFGGTAIDNKFINCETHGGIHGFVSKGDNTSFINCRAFATSQDGFALVADNITGASLKSFCRNNKLVNCEVYNSNIGIYIYSRDYFSTNNANGLELKNLSIVGGNIKDSATYGMLVGDEAAPGGGQTFNDVLNISIEGVNIDTATTNGIKYSRCNGVSVVAVNTNKFFDKDANSKQLKHSNINLTGGSLGDVVFNTVLTANSNNPSITNGDIYFETNNTLSTSIINFSGAKVGQIIWVQIKDAFTSIANSATITLSKTVTGNGSSVLLKRRDDDSGWYEIISNSVNGNVINQTAAPQNASAWIGNGSESLKVGTNTGNPDHAYIGLYARTATPTTRSASIGYLTAAVNDLSIVNAISTGDILYGTTGTGANHVFTGSQLSVAPNAAGSQSWSFVLGSGDTAKLDVANDTSINTSGPVIQGRANRGASSTLSADILLDVRFAGQSTSSSQRVGASIRGVATANFLDTDFGSKLDFYTVANGTTTQVKALTIDQDGSLVHAGNRTGTATKQLGVDSSGKFVENVVLNFSQTYDVPSLAAGAVDVHTVSVPGCALGDFVIASMDTPLGHYLTLKCYVSSSGSVDVVFHNTSTGVIDLTSATLRIRVIR